MQKYMHGSRCEVIPVLVPSSICTIWFTASANGMAGEAVCSPISCGEGSRLRELRLGRTTASFKPSSTSNIRHQQIGFFSFFGSFAARLRHHPHSSRDGGNMYCPCLCRLGKPWGTAKKYRRKGWGLRTFFARGTSTLHACFPRAAVGEEHIYGTPAASGEAWIFEVGEIQFLSYGIWFSERGEMQASNGLGTG